MGNLQAISTSCPRGGRPLVEDAVALRVSDLRSHFGWFRTHALAMPDGAAVKLSLNIGEADTFAWVKVEHWPAGARWATLTYTLDMRSSPARFGGLRWWFLCPETGDRVSALYLSPDGKRLACRAALGLAHRSQRQRAPARAAARARRIRADLDGDGVTRPKGQHAATYARRLALLAELDGRAGTVGLASPL